MDRTEMAAKRLPRRTFLTLATGGLALIGLGAACQSAAPSPTGGSAPTAAPAPRQTAGSAASPAPSARPAAAPAESPSAAPSAAPAQAKYTNTVTINFGSVVPSVNQMAPYIAEKHGFLEEFGVKLQQTTMQTSTDIVHALVSGSVDVAETSPPSLVVAYAKGGNDLAVISGMVDKVAYTLMAAKDITQYSQLKGKTIGISSFGDGLTVITKKLLQKGGLGPNDYHMVALGSSGQRYAALRSGGAQAVVISQPFDFQLQRQGYTRLGDTTEVESDYSFIVLGSRRSWVSKNTEAATRMLAALVKGQDFLLDPANKAAVLKDMETYAKTAPQDASDTYDLLVTKLHAYAPHLEPSTAGMQAVIDISAELGSIKPPLPTVASLLDLDPLHAAQKMV